jgi:hypothetical protein
MRHPRIATVANLSVAFVALVTSTIVACGGSVGDGTDAQENGKSESTKSSSTTGTTGTTPTAPSSAPTTPPWTFDGDACCSDTAPVCVDVEATDFSQSCAQDSDCTPVFSGSICNGAAESCTCPNSAIATSALDAYEAATSLPGTPTVACSCPAIPEPRCVANRCAMGTFDLPDGG